MGDGAQDIATTRRIDRSMGYVIAFVNHKGGVTKTTSVANTGAALAQAGERVLVVDADPQANLTEAFAAVDVLGTRLEDVLADVAAPTGIEVLRDVGGVDGALDLLPCSDALADVAADLPRHTGYELRLRAAVDSLRDDYDFILVDTPPGLGILSGMALLAADAVIIPVRPADFDVGGAAKVYDLIEETVREVHPEITILGVLVAQAQHRWILRRETQQAIERYGMEALPVEIPFSVRVGSAPRYGQPTVVLEPGGRVAQAYRALATFLIGTTAKRRVAA